MCDFLRTMFTKGWLGSRVVSMLDSGAEGPGSNHCRVTVLGKLFTPIVPLFTKQQNWQRGQLQAWRKVMAAYCRVYDSRHLQADASLKSRLVLPFWYWLTRVVPDKGPLNGCVCVTCRLTAKNRDQLRNPTLGHRVWATFTFFMFTENY